MKILILSEDYPSECNPYALSYIHSRLLCYNEYGIKCTVLSFKAKSDYFFEGVKVVNSISCLRSFDVVLSHAPNIKNHARFILYNLPKINKLVFWIHGHEVMNVYKEYPTPYSWSINKRWRHFLHFFYSPLKLFFMRAFFHFVQKKCLVKFVFVSEWMKGIFSHNIANFDKSLYYVVPNPVNSNFINNLYKIKTEHYTGKGICIRPWDDSKYAVDMVVDFFRKNPSMSCDIYGRGVFPKKNSIPQNVNFKYGFLIQSDIPSLLNQYDFAILPTRLDAQGVFACELATYGIPLIVNDIPIMREMLSTFPNVIFLRDIEFSLEFKGTLPNTNAKIDKFNPEVIIAEELKVINDY